MTLNTVSCCKVSPQNEFLNVLATQMNWQMTLNTGSSCKVSHQYELLNVSSSHFLPQRTLCTVSSWMVSPQCELSYVFSISISCQMTWNTGCNGGVWSAWSLLPTVEATGLNLCSARHPLLPLICLESERSLSAHPPALLLHLIQPKHLLASATECRTGITSASKGPGLLLPLSHLGNMKKDQVLKKGSYNYNLGWKNRHKYFYFAYNKQCTRKFALFIIC